MQIAHAGRCKPLLQHDVAQDFHIRIGHSLVFCVRERLLVPSERWRARRQTQFRRVRLLADAMLIVDSLVARAEGGVACVAAAAATGTLRVDDELHLTSPAADEEDPELVTLRAALDRRIGEAQLSELSLANDAEVLFS